MKACSSLLYLIACMSSFLLILPQQAFTLESPANSKTPIKQLQPTEIDEWKIKEIARSITVKISSNYNNIPSSGILIDKQERKGEQSVYLYLVLTNNHVVRDKKANYKVETSDGRIYKASLYLEYNAQFGNDIDLDLLYFSSNISYEKARLGNSSIIKNEEKVFVGGFACPDSRFCEKESKFIFEPGTVLLLDEPLVRYYQMAYTSNTKSGTSGGVVLNKKGELIAINGQGKYALGNDQYSYVNDKQPSPEVIKFMRHFAWGIPINTYRKYSLQAPLDKVQLPTQSAITEYITIPANINNENSWLNNTNIIFAFIFILTCAIGYLVNELRIIKSKVKVDEKK